jgi:hypothetical protein
VVVLVVMLHGRKTCCFLERFLSFFVGQIA